MTPQSYDVVIVGARCAGATLATFLVRAGASVLLLEKDRLRSDQILSTHTIHPPGLDILDEVGVGAADRPHTSYVFERTKPSSTSSFPRREPSTVLDERASTVSCKLQQRPPASRSSTECA